MTIRIASVVDGVRVIREMTQEEWDAENPPVVPSTDPLDYPLNPAQFQWLLAVSGLDDVLDTVLAATKAADLTAYANLKKNLNRKTFLFDVTMALVGEMETAGAIPAGADVSAATIGALWMQAKDE